MEYPKNGGVLIIDDQYGEIEGLIKVLNKNKVPTYYFDGRLEDFPEEGFENIRLVFLDINLDADSESGGNEKIIVSKLMQVLRRAINKNNGQYLLATWSTMSSTYFHALEKDILSDLCKDKPFLHAHPEEMISINKSAMKKGEVYDLDLIKETIKGAISNSIFLPYYISWENMVQESAKKVLNSFDTASDEHTDIKKIISLFANASPLIDMESSENDILQYGFTPLSTMLIEELQSKVSDEMRLNLIDEGIKNEVNDTVQSYIMGKETIDDNDIALVNTLYHIDNLSTCMAGTCSKSNGQVYLYDDYLAKCCTTQGCNTKWAEDLTQKVFDTTQKTGFIQIKRGPFLERYTKLETKPKGISRDEYAADEIESFITKDVIPIFLEISPDCDVAHGKRKKLRLVFGVMIPAEFNFKPDGDSFTDEIMIQYNKINYKVMFDLHTMTGINFDVFESINPIFRFKKEFVTEVQHKVATHISRPGFFNMRDYK